MEERKISAYMTLDVTHYIANPLIFTHISADAYYNHTELNQTR